MLTSVLAGVVVGTLQAHTPLTHGITTGYVIRELMWRLRACDQYAPLNE